MRFLLVEDEWQIRDAMRYTLQSIKPDSEILEATSVQSAIGVLAQTPHAVDLILLDLNLDDSSGIDTLKNLNAWKEQNHCSARIVVISGEDDVALVARVIENFGTGFILKATPRHIFVRALELTIAGGVYLPEVLCARLVSRAKTPAEPERAPIPLTQRECEIASQLIQGKQYKQIALDLEKKDGKRISEHTVRAHVTNIAWKLGVSENGKPGGKAGVMAEIARRGLTFPP